MKTRGCFGVILISACALFGDVLVGDLENGTKRNSVGGDWYYFSDANDSGNSVIYNAVQNPDGSYSDLAGIAPGHESNLGAQLRFKLGNKLCIREGSNPFDPYVGMGTDIAKPGETVDLRAAKSISFWARGAIDTTDTLKFVLQIVTANIGAHEFFDYYQTELIAHSSWKRYIVDYSQFWGGFGHPFDSSLAKTQKINWQVTGCCKEGYLAVDDVVIEGVDSLRKADITSTRQLPAVPSSPKLLPQPKTYDLLGRLLGSSQTVRCAAAIYIRQSQLENGNRMTARAARRDNGGKR